MIKTITLAQFKKHEHFIQTIDQKIVLIYGNNACGKTSILEAISLFTPGGGIFSHDINDLIMFGKNAYEILINSEYCTLSASYIKDTSKKEFRINNTAKRKLDLPEYIRIYGLTPYIAFAFWKDSSIRRKHIDRLMAQNDLRYAALSAKFAKAMKDRNKLIEVGKLNEHMKSLYNRVLIENGLEITRIRQRVIEKLNTNMHPAIHEFLGSNLKITMSPTFEEQEKIFANELEDYFIGPHKTKFTLSTNEFDGNTASTGQQKKLLIALTIAALPETDASSVLLLDDLFANLDEQTITQLMHILNQQHFQTWITNIEDIETQVHMQKIRLD